MREQFALQKTVFCFSHVVSCDEIALWENPALQRNSGLKRTQTDAKVSI
jgi:hypothetical protein